MYGKARNWTHLKLASSTSAELPLNRKTLMRIGTSLEYAKISRTPWKTVLYFSLQASKGEKGERIGERSLSLFLIALFPLPLPLLAPAMHAYCTASLHTQIRGMSWCGMATFYCFKEVLQINRLSPNRDQSQSSDQRLDSVGVAGEHWVTPARIAVNS